jgi:ankyrin repeat protein
MTAPLSRTLFLAFAIQFTASCLFEGPVPGPVSRAARSGDLPTMWALVTAGVDPNVRDEGGNRWVPLMHAVHKHRTSAVRFLLEHGARPDGPPGLRITPLMMAAASGQTDVVGLLLDRGANPHTRLPGGGTLLDLAVSGGALTDIDEPLLGACHTATVRLLLARAPDLRVTGTLRGRLSLFFARLNGCREVLDLVNTVAQSPRQ